MKKCWQILAVKLRVHLILVCVKIVSIGEVTLDHYLINVTLDQWLKVDPTSPVLDTPVETHIGGISLNFAIHAKRCGATQVSLISRVNEKDMAQLRSTLSYEGVDHNHVYGSATPTAHQHIILTPSGERIFPSGGYGEGCMAGFRLNPSDIQFAQMHDIIASPLFRQSQHLFDDVIHMPFSGWRVADFLDLADFDDPIELFKHYLPHLNIAFVGGNASLIPALKPLSTQFSTTPIVITLGAQGSVALLNGQVHEQSAVSVAKVVDTTGCGDAFQAAFTTLYFETHHLHRALFSGAHQAATVAQYRGAY
jgi:fructoselysine 6-kinase